MDNGLHLGIVTHSPRPYATRVLERVNLVPDELVAYHDLRGLRKPSPFGYELCCKGRDAGLGTGTGKDRLSGRPRSNDPRGCPQPVVMDQPEP